MEDKAYTTKRMKHVIIWATMKKTKVGRLVKTDLDTVDDK